jgi:hypothetical protein
MAPAKDKPTQQKKPGTAARAKVRASINPPGSPLRLDLPDYMLDAIVDLRRTGLRAIGPDEPEHALYCSAEYHFARFTGDGASIALLLYNISWHVAGADGLFFVSGQKLAAYLGIQNDEVIYAAARLLVLSGFWEVAERKLGKAVRYRLVSHEEWAQRHPGFCITKYQFPFQDDDDVAQFGKRLHGILGGERFYRDVLRGWYPKYGTADELCADAVVFMKRDAGQSDGVGRRKRLGTFFREQAAKRAAASDAQNTSDLPTKRG